MVHKIFRTIIDDKVHVSYTFDDAPTMHAEVKGPLADRARKNQFAIKELELCNLYLRRVEKILQKYEYTGDDSHECESDSEDSVDMQSYFSTATICYGKIFTNVGTGRRQFLPKDFFSGDALKFKPLHEWWMDVRHRYIAHSAGEPYDSARVVMLFHPPYFGSAWWHCFPHVQFNKTPPINEIRLLIGMVGFMLDFLSNAQQTHIEHMASNFTLDEISYYRGKAVYASPVDDFPPAPVF